MKISKLEEVIKFDDREELIKSLMYLKLAERKIKFSENELNILAMFSSNDNIKEIKADAFERKYVRNKMTVDNFVSRGVDLSLLKKIGTGRRKIHEKFFPEIDGDIIAATFKIHNYAGN